MDIKLDWLSLTLPITPVGELSPGAMWGVTLRRLADEQAKIIDYVPNDARWQPAGGRAPYRHSWEHPAGVRVYFGPNLDTVLFEYSGRGCAWLREQRYNDHSLCLDFADRMTRVDIAVDIEDDVQPSDFVAAGYTGRMAARSTWTSSTGETEYIGSMKSDRYCRVYRYAEPHPRSHLMRVEMVHRRAVAKTAAAWVAEQGVARAALAAANSYCFRHPSFSFQDATVGTISAPTVRQDDAGTELWLIKQAAPAFQRLVREGVIQNPQAWLDQHFLPRMY